MSPLSGQVGRAVARRRQAIGAAAGSLLPARARRLPRLGMWLLVGLFVLIFATATDATSVAVVAVPAAIAAAAWRQLSWPVRVLIVAGLAWLSVAQLGPALGLALDGLLLAWWWLPTQVGDGSSAAAPAPDAAEGPTVGPAGAAATGETVAFGADLASPDYGPGLSGGPGGLPVPLSLRRFAEERRLSEAEVAMLASIRFPGGPPRTAARWQHIYNAIRLSRWLDKEDV